eukprot:COSAG02_NODE_4124_length_5744_cov_7.379451_7_plen_537_part_01
MWNVKTGALIRELRGGGQRPAAAHDDWVTTLCAVGEGMVASGGGDGAIRVWGVRDGQLLREMRRAEEKGAEGGGVGGAADGKAAHDDAVRTLCAVGEGMVASGGGDGAIRVWGVRDGQLLREMRRAEEEGAEGGGVGGAADKAAHDGEVWTLCAVGEGMVASGGQDGAICVWGVRDGQLLREMRRAEEEGAEGGGVGGAADGKAAHDDAVMTLCAVGEGMVASGGGDGAVRVWGVRDGQLLREMRRAEEEGAEGGGIGGGAADKAAHDGAVMTLCAVGEGMVASGGDDGAVRVWGVRDGQLLCEMRRAEEEGAEGGGVGGAADKAAHDRGVMTLCAVGEGMVASGGWDGAVRVWSMAGATMVRCDQDVSYNAWCVLSDGLIVAGGGDGSVEFRSTKSTAAQYKALRPTDIGAEGGGVGGAADKAAHDGAVSTLCAVGEGMVASGGGDGAIRVWDARDGKLLCEMRRAEEEGAEGGGGGGAAADKAAHDGEVNTLCAVGEGMVASGGWDGAIRVWGARDGQLLREMRRAEEEGAEGGG